MSAQTGYIKIKAAGYLLLNCFGALLISISGCEETVESGVVDIDGNAYDTVRIGTQVWMKENLRTTRFNDGTEIQLVPDGEEWKNMTTPGYCWYGNNEAFFSLNHFGALYNGYAARSDKILRGLRMTEFLYDVSGTRVPRPQTFVLNNYCNR